MQTTTTFEVANATKFPEQVAVVIARDAAGKYNPITLGWLMQTSFEPPMMAFSIGKTRYSLEVVRAAGEFVIVFPSDAQETETLLYGTKSGRECDKLAEAGANTSPACEIDCVLLDDAAANFECRLAGELASGDHVIFVGEVVCSHTNTQPLKRLYTTGDGYAMTGLPRASLQD
ncbi:MAG: flavin reductase family protein [Planctomycetota bacterium]